MAEQRTFEWYASRYGKITMSKRIDTIMTGQIHALNNLIKELKWEQEQPMDVIRADFERETRIGDASEAMTWGRDHEEEAIHFYEMTRNVEVIRAEFIVHPDYPNLVGDSTDFLETEDGTLTGTVIGACEIKCPFNPANHKKTIRYGMGTYHHNQTQGHLECHNLKRGLFVSYDPRHPVEKDKLYIQEIWQDLAWKERFKERMTEFANHFENGTLYEHKTTKATDGLPSMF